MNAALKAQFANYYLMWPQPWDVVTLLPCTGTDASGDTFGAAVTCPVCRITPIDSQTAQSLGLEMGNFYERIQVWDRGQTLPKIRDRIRDSDGVNWRVLSVHLIMYGNNAIVTAVKEV